MDDRILYHELESDYTRSRHIKLSTLKPGHLVRTNKERIWIISERIPCTPPIHIYLKMVRAKEQVYFACRNDRLGKHDEELALYVLTEHKITCEETGRRMKEMIIYPLEEVSSEDFAGLLREVAFLNCIEVDADEYVGWSNPKALAHLSLQYSEWWAYEEE